MDKYLQSLAMVIAFLSMPNDSSWNGATGRIVVYHRIHRSSFLRQLMVIQEHFDVISLSEATYRLQSCSKSANGCPFAVIAFDDGYRDILHVSNDLVHLNVPACLYITTGFIGRPGHLGLDELKYLSHVFEIGSHTISHPCLLQLPQEKLVEELENSKKWLEDLLSQPIVHFASPFGGHSSFDCTTVRVAASLGYQTFRTTFRGWNMPHIDDKFGIQILKADPVHHQWSTLRLKLTLAGVLDWKHIVGFRRVLGEDIQ